MNDEWAIGTRFKCGKCVAAEKKRVAALAALVANEDHDESTAGQVKKKKPRSQTQVAYCSTSPEFGRHINTGKYLVSALNSLLPLRSSLKTIR